jgi:hypothetical protein
MKMEYGKAALAVVLIILSILGFGVTWTVYSVLNVWNNMPPSQIQEVGYGLSWPLPTLTAIFSLMFMLLGIYLLHESIKRPKNTAIESRALFSRREGGKFSINLQGKSSHR